MCDNVLLCALKNFFFSFFHYYYHVLIILNKTGVLHSASKGRHFCTDFESMGQMTWDRMKETADVFMKDGDFFFFFSLQKGALYVVTFFF